MPQKKKQAAKVDKRYRAKVVIPGLDKPIWVSAKTKRELEDEKRRVKEEYVNGPWREDMPFVDLIREWYETVKKPSFRTHSTEREWESAMNNYVYPAFDPRKLANAVTRKDLQNCLNNLAGKNKVIIGIVTSALKKTCQYAVLQEQMRIDQSMMLIKPKAKELKTKSCFTLAEETKLLSAMQKVSSDQALVVSLLYYTGMRSSEIQGIQWKDVLWEKRLLHVHQHVDTTLNPEILKSYTKTNAGTRYIPIADPLYLLLEKERGMPDHFILSHRSTPFTRQELVSRLYRVLIAAGLAKYDGDKSSVSGVFRNTRTESTPHRFRHHFVTSCVQAEFRPEYVMSIVGHASYETTISVYTHIQHQMLEDDFKPTMLSKALQNNTKVAKRLPE